MEPAGPRSWRDRSGLEAACQAREDGARTASSDANANTCAAPNAFHGSTTRQSGAAVRAIVASASGLEYAEWFVATTTTSAPLTASSNAGRRRRDDRVVHRDVGELALEQPDQLVRERIALVVGVALEREPEHGDLALAQSRRGAA